ncbi:helix-turn-helix domain-containing protein [Candidatus Soleaferrea massiliensis]|uniref:helix-turn-helix domain-containing protein n=1 Tax=Candidatus Soleaferrea massiliensis TaxID=1470354 RepID=UPI001FA7B6EE|nr:helix-turn-helix transcriptional regulator [Candidatus Soleaferrea massiliensis]
MKEVKPLHERIRELREDHDLKQEDVAKFLGIKQQYYSNYEMGTYVLPIRHLISLAELYQCNTDYILGLTGYEHSLDKLREPFYHYVTLGSVVSDIISLVPEKRKMLLDYLTFLVSLQEK